MQDEKPDTNSSTNVDQSRQQMLTSLYPVPTIGALAEHTQADTSTPGVDLRTIRFNSLDDLRIYLHKQIIRRCIASAVLVVIEIYLAFVVVRQFLFWESFAPDIHPLMYVLVAFFIVLPVLSLVVCSINLANIRSIRRSYEAFNRLYYEPMWRIFGYVQALVSVLSFVRFLNPAGWILQPERKFEFLSDTAVSGLGSYVAFQQADRAAIMGMLLSRYFASLDARQAVAVDTEQTAAQA